MAGEPDPGVVAPLVDACRRILAGQHPSIQGAVIADLLSMFLAGHVSADAADTRAHRAVELRLLVGAALDLVPINARLLGLPH